MTDRDKVAEWSARFAERKLNAAALQRDAAEIPEIDKEDYDWMAALDAVNQTGDQRQLFEMMLTTAAPVWVVEELAEIVVRKLPVPPERKPDLIDDAWCAYQVCRKSGKSKDDCVDWAVEVHGLSPDQRTVLDAVVLHHGWRARRNKQAKQDEATSTEWLRGLLRRHPPAR
jgi:hypothetical protein